MREGEVTGGRGYIAFTAAGLAATRVGQTARCISLLYVRIAMMTRSGSEMKLVQVLSRTVLLLMSSLMNMTTPTAPTKTTVGFPEDGCSWLVDQGIWSPRSPIVQTPDTGRDLCPGGGLGIEMVFPHDDALTSSQWQLSSPTSLARIPLSVISFPFESPRYVVCIVSGVPSRAVGSRPGMKRRLDGQVIPDQRDI